MMKKVMIQVGDKSYPCYRTMRGMVDQQRENLDTTKFEGVLKAVFITIRGACIREEVDFPYDFEAFTDKVEPDVMEKFGQLHEAGDKTEPDTAGDTPAVKGKKK